MIYTMEQWANDRTFKTDPGQEITASNYEATLYRYKYNHGERVETNILYDPWKCFEE